MTADRIDAFFDRPDRWGAELRALRALLLAAGLDETWKWRSPVYCEGGGNVAIVWGFRDAATLGFFKGVLLKDADGHLCAPGPNSRSSRVARFTTTDQIEAASGWIAAYLAEAILLERQDATVDLPPDDLSLPDELAERLAADPDLSRAWDALTPGRRRGYVVQISGAKQSSTRAARIERHVPLILAGKGLHDR